MLFTYARILITTCFSHFIKGWILLKLGDRDYDIFVKEVGSSGVSFSSDDHLLSSVPTDDLRAYGSAGSLSLDAEKEPDDCIMNEVEVEESSISGSELATVERCKHAVP